MEKWSGILLSLIILILCCFHIAQAAPIDIQDASVPDHSDKSQIGSDLSAPSKYKTYLLEGDRNPVAPSTINENDYNDSDIVDIKGMPLSIEELDEIEDNDSDLLDNVHIYGDFRIRAVDLAINRQNEPNLYQAKVRFRLGGEYTFIENQLLVGARLTTGDRSNPRSTDASLGDGFEGLEISLDRAYLKYNPFKGATLMAGKFNLPLKKKAIYNVLVWDSDVQPEGIAANYKWKNLWTEIYFTIGQYMVEEVGGDISWLTAPQLAVTKTLNEYWEVVLAGGGYLYYGHGLTPGGSTVLVNPPKNRGNAEILNEASEPIEFDSDFHILDTFLDIKYSGFNMPITLSGEYIHNFGANISRDTGYAVGVQLGKAKKAREWELYYQFQLIEQDAIFTPFSQDDFLLATNFKGHVAGWRYKIRDNIAVHLRALISKPDKIYDDIEDKTNYRARAEIIFSF